MAKKVPTIEEYQAYDGAHCFQLWRALDEVWRCQGCGRSKLEIMLWSYRTPHGREPFWGWMAELHTHHDHECAWCAQNLSYACREAQASRIAEFQKA